MYIFTIKINGHNVLNISVWETHCAVNVYILIDKAYYIWLQFSYYIYIYIPSYKGGVLQSVVLPYDQENEKNGKSLVRLYAFDFCIIYIIIY